MSELEKQDYTPKAEPITLYEAHKKIYTRAVKGHFNTLRTACVLLTQLVFFGLPWLTWNGKPAVFFDIANRKFHLFALTIWPQDFIYLAALLMTCAFALFAWTAVAGRLWCGYACPQTVYTEIMIYIERWIEGDRNQQIKLAKAPMSLRKFRIKATSHGIMILLSLWTGFTLVGYFTPIRELIAALPSFDYSPWETFWILFYAGFTYLFAAHMREQVCKYMCPYARFQSVMFDADTLIISYDEKRGEPRGFRKKDADYQALNLGACINCNLCVHVCPTGIDIRNGLQYECIGCAACVDVCDEVMDKMGYPRGLVRYTTENALKGVYPEKEITKRLQRPRVILYALILLAVLGTAITSFMLRAPFKVDVMRDRVELVRETDDGLLENTYLMKIINTTDQEQHFRISVKGLPDMQIETHRSDIKLAPTELTDITIHVRTEPHNAPKGSHKIYFVVESTNHPGLKVEEKSSFIGE